MRKHLFYNLCAFSKNEEWRRNLDELAPYLHVFDGRRLVVVRTGKDLVAPEIVEAAFPSEAEFVRLPNNPALGEVERFIELLSSFEPVTKDEALFYAHTKGVRHEREPHQMLPIRQWRQYMLQECLSDIEKVDAVLQQHPCCGTYFWQQPSKSNFEISFFYRHWHYAGTFWWVNLHRLFSKPRWRKINQNRFGVEDYLPLHFRPQEVFKLGVRRPASPYDILWTFHCRSCNTSFKEVTSIDRPARPICVVCKKESEPEPVCDGM